MTIKVRPHGGGQMLTDVSAVLPRGLGLEGLGSAKRLVFN
jgi:hypothetical protein